MANHSLPHPAAATARPFRQIITALLLAMICMLSTRAWGQSAAPAINLFVNPKTKVVYTEAGPGRVPLGTFGQIKSATQMERDIEAKTQAQLAQQQRALALQFEAQQEQQRQWNAEISKEVSDMYPAWRDFGDRWYKKISVGTLVYGDWSMYTHTGWGPQFLENIYTPGPGNNEWNSFDITRAYLDTRFAPSEDLSLRLTPELYKQFGTAQPDKIGRLSAVNSNLDGSEGVRIKYAYLDYKTFFRKVLRFEPAKEDVLTFGIQQNPFITWEENLWGYRYVTLSPWNYAGLSSAAIGLRLGGPIKFHEKQYIDYEVGAFDNGTYKQYDASSTKQVMGRVSVYPFGAKSQFQGLGLTGFYQYAYPNTYAPDRTLAATSSAPLAFNAGANGHIVRSALTVSYQGDSWQLAAQYDWGHNAFNASSYFNGAAPVDAFSSSFVSPAPTSIYGPWAKMVGIFQNPSNTVQQGVDLFGHWDIPETPFDLFGLYSWFQPNTKVTKNPLDFERWVGGIEWKVNKNLRIALDSQNLLYYHGQFTVPASELANFTTFTKASPPFSVSNAVPTDVHAFYLNLEFRY
ncbi:MAG TPA: hypothetical protein VMA09_13880 [Candidatus Binataceae bacterium]|nr:hypothetical protein [Candidatus Binataceae bacterium]